jgi:hypothetical protein
VMKMRSLHWRCRWLELCDQGQLYHTGFSSLRRTRRSSVLLREEESRQDVIALWSSDTKLKCWTLVRAGMDVELVESAGLLILSQGRQMRGQRNYIIFNKN